MDLREAELEQRGKENVDLVNRMRAYEDPLLAAFDQAEAETAASKKGTNKAAGSDDSDDSSGSEETSSDGSQEGPEEINFPRNNCEDLLRFI